MSNITKPHPHRLASLTIVRDRSEFSTLSAIRSTAIFTVTLCQQSGARFAVDHRAYDRSTTRAEIIDGVAARIPTGATLIAQACCFPRHYLRHSLAAGRSLPPADLQLLQRERRDLDVLPMECRNGTMAEIAAAYSINRAGPSSSVLDHSRKAPNEAQCLWLAFLWSQQGTDERTRLSAAWEAWRAIERARSVGF